jgi:hypothetical protein
MKWVFAGLLALLEAGCAFGGGSSNVGQWRAQRVVDSTACVQSENGQCQRTVAIGRDLPARSFGGGVLALGSSGYVQRRSAAEPTEHGAVFDTYYEYFRGRGRFAVGGRVGADAALFQSRVLFLLPVSLVLHAGGGWGSLYAGGGYSLVASETFRGEAAPPAGFYHDSAHVIVGTRLLLREAAFRRITANPELRFQTLGGSSLLSLTANIGIHL